MLEQLANLMGSALEFSRQHCVAVCAVLVPANLLATVQTLIMAGIQSPPHWLVIMALGSSLYALLMMIHVLSWFWVGVVMAPTFILVALGLVCLSLNAWAVFWPDQVGTVERVLLQWLGITPRFFSWDPIPQRQP